MSHQLSEKSDLFCYYLNTGQAVGGELGLNEIDGRFVAATHDDGSKAFAAFEHTIALYHL